AISLARALTSRLASHTFTPSRTGAVHWVSTSRRANSAVSLPASRIGSMQAMEGAPMLRSRPALMASSRSAPPRSAASAVVPEPMAAPMMKRDNACSRVTSLRRRRAFRSRARWVQTGLATEIERLEPLGHRFTEFPVPVLEIVVGALDPNLDRSRVGHLGEPGAALVGHLQHALVLQRADGIQHRHVDRLERVRLDQILAPVGGA